MTHLTLSFSDTFNPGDQFPTGQLRRNLCGGNCPEKPLCVGDWNCKLSSSLAMKSESCRWPAGGWMGVWHPFCSSPVNGGHILQGPSHSLITHPLYTHTQAGVVLMPAKPHVLEAQVAAPGDLSPWGWRLMFGTSAPEFSRRHYSLVSKQWHCGMLDKWTSQGLSVLIFRMGCFTGFWENWSV